MKNDHPSVLFEKLERRKAEYISYDSEGYSLYNLLKPIFFWPFVKLGFFRVIQSIGNYLMFFIMDVLTDAVKDYQDPNVDQRDVKIKSLIYFAIMILVQLITGLAG